MREAVMFLSPECGGLQVVQGCHRQTPGDLYGHFEELGILVHHGEDDIQKSLVGREQSMATGQEIALQPGLDGMLTENLYDTSIVCTDLLVMRRDRPLVVAPGRFEHRSQFVRLQFVRAEDAERMRVAFNNNFQIPGHLLNIADVVYSSRQGCW